MAETLIADKRSQTGKGPNRRLRNQGRIPAVLYSRGTDPISLAVDPKILHAAVTGPLGLNTLLELDVQDKGSSVEKHTALLRDYQIHPLKGSYVHADFIAIDLSKPIRIRVPIEVTGKALGVVEGGLIQIIRRDIGISCLPANIPSSISVDVSEMNIGDSLHVRDVIVGENVTATDEEAWTVLTCAAPEVEKVEETEAEAIEGEAPAEGAAEGAADGDKKEEAAPAS